MAAKRVYPDTNVALHYKAFSEIDWCSLVGADEVEIVITAVFLREIDELKDRARGAVQKRARNVSSWLADLRKSGASQIRPRVRVVVDSAEPEAAVDFAKLGLVPTINDDRFLACLIRDRDKLPDAELVCVTADNPLAFKCDGRAIQVVEPSKEDRLADEPDEQEKENRELRRKLEQFENAVPDLQLCWPDGNNFTTVSLVAVEPLADQEIENYVDEESDEMTTPEPTLLAVGLKPPSEKARTEYLKKLTEWLREQSAVQVKRGLTFDIGIILSNKGRGNATEIDIDLVFPRAVRIGENREMPELAKRPKRPKAKGLFDVPEFSRTSSLNLAPDVADLWRDAQAGPVYLSFVEEEPNKVRIVVRSLKHTTNIALPCFEAWFESDASVSSGFPIDYQIHSASTPILKTGQIHVKLDVMRDKAIVPEENEADEGRSEAEAVD